MVKKTYQQFTNSFSTTAMVAFLHFSDGNLQFSCKNFQKRNSLYARKLHGDFALEFIVILPSIFLQIIH